MEPNIAFVAGLVGEPARASMLTALMGGKALTATELALEAGITAQTASNHLAKLVGGHLLIVRKQGRHKYFQLYDHSIAELLEKLLTISAGFDGPKAKTGPADSEMRRSRVCYDHLAGELAVSLYDALLAKSYIADRAAETSLTPSGEQFFSRLGFDINAASKRKRPLCRSCLDWSERRNHLAGSLGQWILADLYKKQWAIKDMDSRTVRFTESGMRGLTKTYGVSS